jgi:hypothetical protein
MRGNNGNIVGLRDIYGRWQFWHDVARFTMDVDNEHVCWTLYGIDDNVIDYVFDDMNDTTYTTCMLPIAW